jgi:hypothetical protein
MPYTTEEEKRDFVRQIVSLLSSNATNLKDLGYDTKKKITELTGLHDVAEQAESEQRNAEAAHRAATQASQEATSNAYKAASSTADLGVGLVGKDNALAKSIRGMRK